MNQPASAAAAPGSPTLGQPPRYRPWLHVYALLLIVATYLLVTIGGNVTSLGVGMDVPHGWWTFEYFTLWAPLSTWWHDMGTRWEHSHRLKGYVVGFMTIGMMLSLWCTQGNSPWPSKFLQRIGIPLPSNWFTQAHRPWLQWAGVGLLLLVIVQGVMGAMRVDLISQFWATLHGITGQLFFALTVIIATATSRVWLESQQPEKYPALWRNHRVAPLPQGLKALSLGLIALLVAQLALGAWMRHNGAGAAITDFPLHYGRVIPPFDQPDVIAPFSVAAVAVHFSHRVTAYVILAVSIGLVIWLNLRAAGRREIAWPTRWLMLLMAAQMLLGALTIWTVRYPLVATAHQSIGAVVLAVSTWLAVRVYLLDRAARRLDGPSQGEPARPAAPVASGGSGGAGKSGGGGLKGQMA